MTFDQKPKTRSLWPTQTDRQTDRQWPCSMSWESNRVPTLFWKPDSRTFQELSRTTSSRSRNSCNIIKILNTTQPSYLYNLISVQPHCSTRSSDVVTLSRPPSSSSLKVNNRSFRHASPCLESASQGTSPAYWSRRLIILIWSHTRQFVISFITTVIIHYSFSLPLQAQNSSFPQILSSIVLLPFHPLDWLHGLPLFFFVFLGHVGFDFWTACQAKLASSQLLFRAGK